MTLSAAFVLAGQAGAVLPAAPSPENPAEPAETQAIGQSQDAGEDTRIARRIEGIFAELPAFAGVAVEVDDGVVTLTGTVPEQADIARAAGIAGRIQGVATIENRLQRDRSVAGGLGTLEQLTGRVRGWLDILPLLGLAVAAALAIGTLGYLIAGMGGLWRRLTPNIFLAELLIGAIRLAFVTLGIVVALEILGAGALLGAVLGGAGIVGIALGFAMRETVENYIASLMLSLRQPFRANDHVVIENQEGRVIRLTSRATILMTLDGNHVRIPNAQVFKAIILNYTRNPQRRFQFELGIDADNDPRVALEIALAALRGLPYILQQPEPLGSIEEVGESSINLRLFGWVDQQHADWLKSRSLAIAEVKDALEAGGFALPEPIYRLRFDPRTSALPLEWEDRSTEDARSGTERGARPQPASRPGSAETDVRPEREIARMVDEEREQAGAKTRDLLDPARPQE